MHTCTYISRMHSTYLSGEHSSIQSRDECIQYISGVHICTYFEGTEIFLGVHLGIFQQCSHFYHWGTVQYINIIRDAFMYTFEGCIQIFLRAAFKH
jgi:hypothetical protein